MNGSRLFIATLTTIYIVSAVKLLEGIFAGGLCFIDSIMTCVFIEPRLRKEHGQAYSKYLSAAPSYYKLFLKHFPSLVCQLSPVRPWILPVLAYFFKAHGV